jgi:hypothetical protein
MLEERSTGKNSLVAGGIGSRGLLLGAMLKVDDGRRHFLIGKIRRPLLIHWARMQGGRTTLTMAAMDELIREGLFGSPAAV